MQIILKKSIDATPALQEYIDRKFLPLAKLVTHTEEKSEAELHLEISRTTRHHKKGEVFLAVANLSVAGTMIRAEASAEDMRVALDEVRTMLSLEIKKFKKKTAPIRSRAK